MSEIKPVFDPQPIGPLGLIVMNSSKEMGEKINQYLKNWEINPEKNDYVLTTHAKEGHPSFIINVDTPRFGSGESKGSLQDTVRGLDLYILCDVTNYSIKYKMYGMDVPMSPDNYFQDLKRIIGAAQGKAKRVTVIMPYLYEGRQHRRTGRESLDCAMALRELADMGVNDIITFDAHDARVQNAIPTTGFEDVQPTYQMLKALLRVEPDLRIDKDNMLIISPDEGAANRNIYYASTMGLNLGMFYKRRDYTRVVNGRNPILRHEYMGEPIENRDVLIADDILATGESMLDLAREMKQRNARRVFLCETFGLFTEGFASFDRAYEEGCFDHLFCTNLTYLPDELKKKPWFVEVDMAKYIAIIIATINHDHSLSPLLNPISRINNLLTNHRAKIAKQDAENAK